MGINDVLHVVSQSLLWPAMIVLVLLLVFSAVCVGSLIIEALTERRHFKANTPRDVNAVHAAAFTDVARVVEDTTLLRDQKDALLMVANNMGLPDEDLFSLAKAEMARVDDRHQRSVRRTDLVTKIGPMMGLICTLVPLGPGIVAMGQGDVDTLSNSLLVAFDGTVAGLVAAVVSMVISSIRKRWYAQYGIALETLMSSILEKAEEARRAGVQLPCGYLGSEAVSGGAVGAGGHRSTADVGVADSGVVTAEVNGSASKTAGAFSSRSEKAGRR